MSFPEQNRRSENNNQRPRNNNNLRGNNRQWVPRGSAPAPAVQTLVPSASVDSSNQNDNGNGAESVNRLVRPVVPNRNRAHVGSRGNPNRFVSRREKDKEEKGKYNRDENSGPLKSVNIPQLVQEIQDKLLKGSVECMICYDMVRRSAPIWSCSSCYSIFHLNCIKKWARAPTSIDLLAEKNQGSNWRCPGCQSVQLMSAKEVRYVCFCGKRPDPPSDLYLTPHSCGEPCGKLLEREIPGSGMNNEDLCPHVCVLQCHPGPCPLAGPLLLRVGALVGRKLLPQDAPTGSLFSPVGSNVISFLTVGGIVVKASAMWVLVILARFSLMLLVSGEVKGEDGVFSCNLTCENELNCGNHVCRETCHPGPCGECELLPGKIKTCCCGKTSLNEDRQSCLDPIPTCSQICDKILPCGLHRCQDICHSGVCPPCPVLVTQKCRCGSTSRTVECYKTFTENDKFTCDKPCGQKKNCGRHRCSERCCPRSNSSSSSLVDWDPHLCSMPCEKKLRCGQHSCTSLCHSGHCPPCLETIFTDLTCACGRTSIPPPLPCGTPRPSCQLPCSVPQPCGHPSSHSCHFGDCPPCSVPIAKECVGGHVVLRNITQTCGAPRRDCRHTCTVLCHPSTPCPDARCEFPVTITCSCGRITAKVPCGAGGSGNVDTVLEASIVQKLPASLQPAEENGQKIPLGQRKLVCDDECAKTERKKVLADAFGVTPPNLDALHFGENASVSELLSDLLRRDAKWVLSVEERCRYLVLGRARGGLNALKVHVFCAMTKEKRDALRLIAERWKLSVNAAGWEPKRFVVVHPPIFDPLLDMDPRLVVALFDLPRDADVSALVLRFGGECELVWLNDKNALAVFSDPARAATAMRRLDQGSVYHGAVAIPQNSGASNVISGAGAWGSATASKDSASGAALKGNPWKKVVLQDSDWKDSSWGAEEWSTNAADSKLVSLKEKETTPIAASSNRWSVLLSGNTSKSSDASTKIENLQKRAESPSVSGSKVEESGLNLPVHQEGASKDVSGDVVDDWEEAYD
ncbi:hypothetical protein DH2020_038456 [Rehmannia glutinosa]|uniref:NF-X1-type zinc finger protein n=1 Tax=Rehmannia glutinosa TaxID=99300 RepID=A0ABR0UZA4_REHGL